MVELLPRRRSPVQCVQLPVQRQAPEEQPVPLTVRLARKGVGSQQAASFELPESLAADARGIERRLADLESSPDPLEWPEALQQASLALLQVSSTVQLFRRVAVEPWQSFVD